MNLLILLILVILVISISLSIYCLIKNRKDSFTKDKLI